MKLLLVGDVMLGRFVNQTLQSESAAYGWGDTLKLFEDADIRICNLECVISDRGVPWSATPKVFHFRSDAKNIAALTTAGFNAVSLANNHSLDFEQEALLDTISALDRVGIRHAGAGETAREASKPALISAGGLTIAFIAFTDNEPAWDATERTPGVFYVPVQSEDQRARRLFDVIGSAKEAVDLVIVSAHWGPNWGYHPKDDHIPFGHAIIDAGADIVFGHSCHVFQGIEIYHGKPILYSTGDFVDDYAVDEAERNDESFIFIIEAEQGNMTGLRLYPTLIRDMQAIMAGPARGEAIAKKMQALCLGFNTRTRWNEREGCLEIELAGDAGT